MSNWLQIDLSLGNFDAETIEDALMAAGAVAVTYKDAADDPVFEPWPGEMPLWQQTRVTGMFPANADINNVRAVLLGMLDTARLPEHRVEILEDRDWTREWLKNFKPVKFGRKLWVVPTAYTPPEPDAVNMMLDPGLAFGTGTHPTTALCLEWLDGLDLAGKTVVDYGCGSGVLGIAAALLGAAHVVCTDIDAQALTATQQNAKCNGVADRVHVFLPQDMPQVSADVVVANILAQPLIMLANNIAGLYKTGGDIGLAGLLREQADEVIAAYPNTDMRVLKEREGWVLLSGRKK